MHLLSWHGSVLCSPNTQGVITHHTLPLAADAPPPMAFDAGRLAERGHLRHPELGLLHIEPAPERGLVHLARDGLYICAEAASPVIKFDRQTPSGWETWLPLSAGDLADLQHILRYRWIERATRRVIRRTAIRLSDGFILRLGGHAIALGSGLAAHIAGRGGNGLPDRLALTGPAGDAELLIAEPRSSALLDTALWPVRARRTAEIVTLAAHRFVTGHEPSQEVFERDTEAALANRGAAGIADLLERIDAAAGPQASPAAPEARRDDALRAWALREIMPWLTAPVPQAHADQVYDRLNATEAWAFIYSFADGDVRILPKPDAVMPAKPDIDRAQCYLALFKAVAGRLPPEYQARLCVCIGDGVATDHGAPIFCFQKKPDQTTILLPDVDFLLSDYLRDGRYADLLSYASKTPTAVFSGSTTGGIITPEVARSCALPRLRAAQYFAGSDKVDFRLPGIAQCSGDEAEAILRQHAFCRLPVLTWQKQFRHRFILSMDGNGATCSRVAIALHSNSVLMKYVSDNQLFYFGGLQPWLHYVPVTEDRDVDAILALEASMPETFRRIAENGRAFAQTYLTEQAIQRYTADLLALYAQAMNAAGEAPIPAPAMALPKTADAAATTRIVGHIQNVGDEEICIGTWLGDVGSRLAIEGFHIALADALPAEGFSYQVIQLDGTLSEPARSGEYRGTRGKNMPIRGFCITTAGSFADSYEVTCEATFVDGSMIGPVAAGTPCRARSNAPLEAMRLHITARAGADLRRETEASHA